MDLDAAAIADKDHDRKAARRRSLQRPRYRIARQRYEGGLANYLDVLSAEDLLLGSLADEGTRVAATEAEWAQDAQRNYLLPRQDSHAWLQLSGAHGSTVMAKLCGVDLRLQAFPIGAVAQTSAARINVIVVNVGSDEQPALQLLFDRASLAYFREAVLDAMDEFDGGLVELGALLG